MTYLLILLVVFIALSPLISMMPSRRQRLLADLRQAAASAGLYVRLEEDRAGERRVLYACARQRGDEQARPVTLERDGDAWSATAGNWPAERLQLLASLPPGATRVLENREGIGVWWDEQGDREDVETIARVLRKLLGRNW